MQRARGSGCWASYRGGASGWGLPHEECDSGTGSREIETPKPSLLLDESQRTWLGLTLVVLTSEPILSVKCLTSQERSA